MHYCLIFKVLAVVFRDSFVILTQLFFFVNNFLKLFVFCCRLFATALLYYHVAYFLSTCFLETFKHLSTSAAPRESYDGMWFLVVLCCFLSFDDFAILAELFFFGKYFFYFLLFFYSYKITDWFLSLENYLC